jgi:uncharacterized membrane protein YgcG
MTKFDDQLYDDLMREHGAALARVTPRQAPRARRVTPRRAVLAGGGFLAAASVAAGVLVTTGGSPPNASPAASPAYAVTKNPDGTVSLAVYRPSGYAGLSARLSQLGDERVVVVPVRAGCPPLPRPARPATWHGPRATAAQVMSVGGKVTVHASGIPAGEILVIGIEQTSHGTFAVSAVTAPPAPSCIAPPPMPPVPPGGGSSSGHSGRSSGSTSGGGGGGASG